MSSSTFVYKCLILPVLKKKKSFDWLEHFYLCTLKPIFLSESDIPVLIRWNSLFWVIKLEVLVPIDPWKFKREAKGQKEHVRLLLHFQQEVKKINQNRSGDVANWQIIISFISFIGNIRKKQSKHFSLLSLF